MPDFKNGRRVKGFKLGNDPHNQFVDAPGTIVMVPGNGAEIPWIRIHAESWESGVKVVNCAYLSHVYFADED